MKLIEKIQQHRRDFVGRYQCEGCGETVIKEQCYDDDNFHVNVTPNWKCMSCGKSTIEIVGKPEPVVTKYACWEVV